MRFIEEEFSDIELGLSTARQDIGPPLENSMLGHRPSAAEVVPSPP